MITPDQELCPLEVGPQVRHRPDDGERLYLGEEVIHLLRERSTALVADGVMILIELLLL